MENAMTHTKQPHSASPRKRSFLKWAVSMLTYGFIVAGIVLGLPKFLAWSLETPYPMAAITSGSMWPVLKEGDLIFVQGVQGKSDIRIGDVIVYRNKSNNTFVIHRVVTISDGTLTTKGDANFTGDAPVAYEDVVGKTFQVLGHNV